MNRDHLATIEPIPFPKFLNPTPNYVGTGLSVNILGHYDTYTGPFTTFAVVPEPSTYALVFVGLVIVSVVRRRRRANGSVG